MSSLVLLSVSRAMVNTFAKRELTCRWGGGSVCSISSAGGSKGSGVCSEESGGKVGITDSEESGGRTGTAGPGGGITSTEGVDGVDGLSGCQPTDESLNIEGEFDK